MMFLARLFRNRLRYQHFFWTRFVRTARHDYSTLYNSSRQKKKKIRQTTEKKYKLRHNTRAVHSYSIIMPTPNNIIY